ncbi:MAG: M3 family metallopeptidase [Actinobacteria bacterium]|nr:M3 family metallopeptidase [Actinomycetota bacterium]
MTSDTQIALSSMDPLPAFAAISSSEIEGSMNELISKVSGQVDDFELSVEPTWEGSLGRLFDIVEPLLYAWAIVDTLKSTKDNSELREAHEALQPKIVELTTRISRSRSLCEALSKLKESSWEDLAPVQQRLVESKIREAELDGVGLEGEQLARFKQIQTDLAALGTKFSNNVLDHTKEFSILLTDPSQVAGIAPPILGLMAKNAADDEGSTDFDPEAGPWKATLDGAVLSGVLRNADDRQLREQLYRAYFTRASSGQFDNNEVIREILRLRKEQASLLGYRNFAEMNFVQKMVDSPETIWSFLAELREASEDGTKSHVERVAQFARETTGDDTFELKVWDLLYWSEKLREKLYGFNSEQLRRYFPFEQVLAGLFEFCSKMFGVRFEAADGEGDVWDPSVRLFKVFDSSNEHVAYIYIDAFQRPGEKRTGAWQSSFTSRHRDSNGELRVPSAWLACNQLPPVDNTPSLMTFIEVQTLFHEMGHALHTMLTKVEFGWAAGTSNVEWDAVEIPSTFMENWCFDKETLMAFARDYETGEPMPEDLFENIAGSRTFGSGYRLASTIWYTELDLEVHDRFDPDSDQSLDEVVRIITDRNLVLEPPEDDQFLCGFEHIFNGGYAAGYYSYLWSEMLSTDVYYAFVEAGRENAYEVGERFRDTILALGGSRHPSEIFREFRGRDPETRPLLDHLGLTPKAS